MNRKKRYWGDKMKDANSEEKNENKQREQRFYSEAFKVWGGGCKNELAGLLMEAGPFAEEEKKRLMQENHSARHALWYLAMIVYFITSDHPGLATGQKTARVLGHLICLREFLRTDQLRLRIVVRRLAEAVFSENPDCSLKWTDFIYRHWFLIREFAAYYGQEEKCFSFSDYGKVRDVVMGVGILRAWWWELKAKRLAVRTAGKIHLGPRVFRWVRERSGKNGPTGKARVE